MHRNNPRKLLQMMQAIVVWFCSKEIRLPGVKAGTKPRTFLEAIFSLKASTVFFPRLQSHVSKHPSLRQYSVILWFFNCVVIWLKESERAGRSVSGVWLFATPWTIAHQAPLSIGFSRQEYRIGLLFTSPGIFLTQGLKREWMRLLSHVRLFATPWTIQSLEFSMPEYWRR